MANRWCAFHSTWDVQSRAWIISGASFLINVPLSDLPSRGLTVQNYQFNLWPRDISAAGNAAISDFAPNATNFVASPVPEPWTVGLLASGLAGLALSRARRNVVSRFE